MVNNIRETLLSKRGNRQQAEAGEIPLQDSINLGLITLVSAATGGMGGGAALISAEAGGTGGLIGNVGGRGIGQVGNVAVGSALGASVGQVATQATKGALDLSNQRATQILAEWQSGVRPLESVRAVLDNQLGFGDLMVEGTEAYYMFKQAQLGLPLNRLSPPEDFRARYAGMGFSEKEIIKKYQDSLEQAAKETETMAKNESEAAAARMQSLRSSDVGEQGKAVNITGDLSAKITPAARQLGADLAAATGGQPKPPQPLKTTSTGTGKAAVNKVIPSSIPTAVPTRAEQAAQASLINRGGMGRSEAILPTPAEQAAQASLINRNETPTSEELLKQRRLRKNPFG